jgi:hypothetical protein
MHPLSPFGFLQQLTCVDFIDWKLDFAGDRHREGFTDPDYHHSSFQGII